MGKTYADCTPATLTGDTTETTLGTITVSAKARRIVGIWCYALAGAALSTAEAVSGIFRLDSKDLDLGPSKWPLDVVTVLTSGAVGFSPRIFPVDIPVLGKEVVEILVTMDMAQTGALKARGGLIYEGN